MEKKEFKLGNNEKLISTYYKKEIKKLELLEKNKQIKYFIYFKKDYIEIKEENNLNFTRSYCKLYYKNNNISYRESSNLYDNNCFETKLYETNSYETFILKNFDLNIFNKSPKEIFIYINNYEKLIIYHTINDKPGQILYYDGYLSHKSWGINGKYHRENDKPAHIIYDNNGKMYKKNWYINDLRHRSNGYAYINYQNEQDNEYYFYGKKYNTYEEMKLCVPHRILKRIIRIFKNKKRKIISDIIYNNSNIYRDLSNLISKYIL